MPKFESHITCYIQDANKVMEVGEVLGWKFSKIDGDPLMGAKPYCYLTRYEPNEKVLFSEMNAAEVMLKREMVPVLRTKIERIIWDTKTGVDEIVNG